ncbi:MAG: phytanoyl-CoA dioxygenase family protein [Flavobacteriales bacterium]|nr:phytanoyl-CoA dioxygenase family protein [Flavobacteriales bacterium]
MSIPRRKVLKDHKLETIFQKEGYVSIPFLNSKEVDILKQAFFDTLQESGGHLGPEDENHSTKQTITYDFTFIDKNIAYKEKVFDIISDAFAQHINKYLDGYKPIIANYIRKKTDGGEVPLHQNWAFIDEKKCTSISIWCPLVDSTIENGTLAVVPKSHKRFGKVRGPMIRSELEDIKQYIIDEKLTPLETKAGNAVILDDSIIHHSAINKTDGLRLTIQLILIPKEKTSIHYHMDLSKDKDKVNVLDVDKNFYMQFNPWKKATNIVVKESFSYTPFSLSIDDFEQQLKAKRFDQVRDKKSIWDSLTFVFKSKK